MNKKWLIGCGGCLGVVLIVAIALGGLAWFGFDSFMKGSGETAKGVFGEKLPEGYTPLFAIPAEGTTVVMMMDMATQRMLFAIAAPLKEGDLDAIASGDTKQVEAFIQGAMSKQGSNNVRGIDLLGSASVKAPEGGDVQVLNFRLETEDQGFMPMSLALMPVQGGKMMNMLIVMDAASSSMNAEEPFTEEFAALDAHLGDIVNDTDVAKGLVTGKTLQQAAH